MLEAAHIIHRASLLILLLAGIAAGQDAQLSGVIQDPSEAGVAGAEITLRSDQTGGRRTTRSSEVGLYSLPTLKPGLYRMTVRASGFETIVREGIELQVGRSEEHTSELQSRENLVCRLL